MLSSNQVYKIIILPILVITISNLEIQYVFLFCQHNSTGGGNLELVDYRTCTIAGKKSGTSTSSS
jgi:hypothetical protein